MVISLFFPLFFRLSSSSVVGESSNLFAGESVDCTIIQRLIEHAQNIAFWVAAEIVSCLNIKVRMIFIIS